MLGASRAGITTVILPKRNEDDLDDLPEELREKMEFVPVENVDEVLRRALLPPEEKKAERSRRSSERPRSARLGRGSVPTPILLEAGAWDRPWHPVVQLSYTESYTVPLPFLRSSAATISCVQ